jgi:hypothetical protein
MRTKKKKEEEERWERVREEEEEEWGDQVHLLNKTSSGVLSLPNRCDSPQGLCTSCSHSYSWEPQGHLTCFVYQFLFVVCLRQGLSM